ncbi:MAG: Brp/Blh family beta-carotene 15,15'-dioxygenase [Balneolia bacterium]|nr:Brp/Blh family beta-carotene 15,15'-dioxygenase [Balneolia bacterium]
MKATAWNSAAIGVAMAVLIVYFIQSEAGFYLGSAFALISLMLIGIPHGSLDHVIKEKTSGAVAKGQFSLLKFLGVYLLTMAVYALFWVWLPAFSLVFFLVMSAYHFGETDLEESVVSQPVIRRLGFLLYGSLLLFGLLANDVEQTTEIISSMLPGSAMLAGFVTLTEQFPILRYAEFIALGLRVTTVRSGLYDHLRIGIILFSALFLPLLEGFLLYFCHHHAWVNLVRVRESLYDDSSSGLYNMIKDMTPFSLISVFGIIILVASSPLWLSHVNPVLLFFILISVLTLPHAGIMAEFYALRKSRAG